jgi:protein-histidine pros-kinase
MKLTLKFNLVLLAVFLIGLAITAHVSHNMLQANARDEVVQNARIMMEAALAARGYTIGQIRPLLETQMKYNFLPQTVPSYSATEIFNNLRKTYPKFTYKEATLNPTNPRDRPLEWEADIVNQFRNDDARVEAIGERDTPDGRSLYLGRPIKIKDPACLVCHSTVDVAPKTMIDLYGNSNGFGWKINETVGAQIVSVPMSVPVQKAEKVFKTFMLSLTGVFAFTFIALNLMLRFIVVRPLARLATLADQVSLGNMDAEDFKVSGKDELSVLAQSFSRMRTSLETAMKMLGGDEKV